jgi:hypothetical protein
VVGIGAGRDKGEAVVADIRNLPAVLWRPGFAAGTWPVEGVAVHEGWAAVTRVGGLQTLELVEGRPPREAGALALEPWQNAIVAMAVRGPTLFGVRRQHGLVAVDVTELAHPRYLGSLTDIGDAVDIAIAGDRAYLATLERGLRVVDLSDPRHLRDLGAIPIPGEAQSVSTDGRTLQVAAGEAGLLLVSLTGDWRALRGRHPLFLPRLLRPAGEAGLAP